MKNLSKKYIRLLVLFLFLGAVPVAQAEMAIITNPSVKEIGLSKDDITNIFLGNKKTYSDGDLIRPVNQSSDSSIRAVFFQKVLNMSESEFNRYWSKLKFTGKGTPPRVISGNEAVRNWVAAHPGAIGYIDGKYLDNSVKVVLIVP